MLTASTFPSTFLQPVNSSKKSILNWVIKLDLIKLPMKLSSSRKNCSCCRQTMCKLCFCSQKEYQKWIFEQSGGLNFKDFPFGAHHGSTSWRHLIKKPVKKLNLWWKMAVHKSAWIKVWTGIILISKQTLRDLSWKKMFLDFKNIDRDILKLFEFTFSNVTKTCTPSLIFFKDFAYILGIVTLRNTLERLLLECS